MKLAPIVLFVYNRPRHTRRTVEALQRNLLASDSDLTIFSDGPKSTTQMEAVNEVRRYVHSITGFKSVTVVERDENLGLARSIIEGVTSVVNKHERIIVLEDDLLTSRCFLTFMNAALEKYKNEERVMQISGYMFPVETDADGNVFFLPFTSSWGWATWQRAWQYFDPSATGYEELKIDRAKRSAFDLENSYPYFKMLESQLRGAIDSWAIRWWLSVFQKSGLTLCPPKTLVQNIGLDGSGIHCADEKQVEQEFMSEICEYKMPAEVRINENAKKRIYRFLAARSKRPIRYWLRRIGNAMRLQS